MADYFFEYEHAGPFPYVNPVDLFSNLQSTDTTFDNNLFIQHPIWNVATIPPLHMEPLPTQPYPKTLASSPLHHSPVFDEFNEDRSSRSPSPKENTQSPRRKQCRRSSKVSDNERGKLLEKNRIAANKHRQRKRIFIEGLESRYNEQLSRKLELREEVSTLRGQLLDLKERLFTHAQCDSHDIQDYINGRIECLNARDFAI